MELIEEKLITRGMVRVDVGEDLVESLEAVASAAGWREAYVTGAGVLDVVELAIGNESQITLDDAEIIGLAGRISRSSTGRVKTALRATVMARGQLHSGRITAAMTSDVLLVIDAVGSGAAAARPVSSSPAIARRSAGVSPTPRSSGFLAASPKASRPSPRRVGQDATTPPSQTFSSKPVVPKPKRNHLAEEEDDDDNPQVDAGDYLQHPQLGLCEVVGDDPSGGQRIRVSTGKLRVLRLDALLVLPGEEDEEGRMVFKITGPRRRR